MAHEDLEFNHMVELDQEDAAQTRQRDEELLLSPQPEDPAETFKRLKTSKIDSVNVQALVTAGLHPEENTLAEIRRLTGQYRDICEETAEFFLERQPLLPTIFMQEELIEHVETQITALKTIARELREHAPVTNEIVLAVEDSIADLKYPLESHTSVSEKINYYCAHFARREALTQ